MPFRVGPIELIILLVIVMMVVGVGRLPQVGGAIGNAIREFRKAQDGESADESAELAGGSRKDQTEEGGA